MTSELKLLVIRDKLDMTGILFPQLCYPVLNIERGHINPFTSEFLKRSLQYLTLDKSIVVIRSFSQKTEWQTVQIQIRRLVTILIYTVCIDTCVGLRVEWVKIKRLFFYIVVK